MYGIESTYQDKSIFKKIESFQGKLLKSALGLKKSCKTRPLFQAIGIDGITVTSEINKLSLFKSMVLSTSRCGIFYQHMLSNVVNGKLSSHKNIVSSVLQICKRHNISLLRYMYDDSYQLKCKNFIRYRPECGIADSVKFTLNTRNFNVNTVNDLLRSYWHLIYIYILTWSQSQLMFLHCYILNCDTILLFYFYTLVYQGWIKSNQIKIAIKPSQYPCMSLLHSPYLL